MKVALIILGFVSALLVAACVVLFLKVQKLDEKLEVTSKLLQQDDKTLGSFTQKEFEAREQYELAAKTYVQAFFLIDNVLKTEAQAKDRLTPESFEAAFNQAYAGFNEGIRLAEELGKTHPETYYGRELEKNGLKIEGNYYSVPGLRQNRDIVLSKFVEGRGAALASFIRSECRQIDDAIVRYAMDKKPTVGTQVTWDQIKGYLRPESRLASSGGTDLMGNPYSIGVIQMDRASVKISEKTYDIFKEAKFDWGQFAPASAAQTPPSP